MFLISEYNVKECILIFVLQIYIFKVALDFWNGTLCGVCLFLNKPTSSPSLCFSPIPCDETSRTWASLIPQTSNCLDLLFGTYGRSRRQKPFTTNNNWGETLPPETQEQLISNRGKGRDMILGHQPYFNVTVKVFVRQKKKKEKKIYVFKITG